MNISKIGLTLDLMHIASITIIFAVMQTGFLGFGGGMLVFTLLMLPCGLLAVAFRQTIIHLLGDLNGDATYTILLFNILLNIFALYFVGSLWILLKRKSIKK